MAEEKKTGKVQQFLSQHGEKVALVVCCLGLLVYLVLMLKGPEDAGSKTLKDEITRLEAEKNKEHADKKAPEVPKLALAGVKPWDEVSPARPTGDWAASLPTEATGTPIKRAVVAVKRIVIPDISFQGTEVALGSVTLKWEVAPEVSKAEAIKNLLDPRKLTSFTIERESGGKWEVLAEGLPASTTTYQDAKVNPRSKYSYRVTPFCDDKDYKKTEPTGRGKTIATPEPVTTLGIWRVTFSQPMKPEEGKGMVYVVIEKFDKVHGAVSIKHLHYTGDKIGWWKKNPQDEAEEPKAVHRLSQGAKSIEVDFDSSMEIKSILQKTFPVQRKRCKEIIGAGGYEKCETLVEKNTVKSFEIVYVDEMKLTQKIFLPDPTTHPMALDLMCFRHGGKKAGAEAPKDDKKETPGAPATSQGGGEVEANLLLQQAESMEGTNKTGALSRYEKLLKDYAHTDLVKRLRTAIETKVRKLKEK